MIRRFVLRTAAGLAATLLVGMQDAAASGLDHRIGYDDSGIWSLTSQRVMLGTLFVAEAGGALWQGGETRLGRTLWQSMDATLAGGVSGALGQLYSVAVNAMAEGTWSRLKACLNPHCRRAFYDSSRNRAGAWCSMAACGNRNKARTYRARHKAFEA